MRAGGHPANLAVMNMFMKKCLEVGELESAVWFLQYLRQEGLKPDATTFTHLISTSASHGNTEGVNFWLQCMEKEELKFDRELSKLLLGVCFLLSSSFLFFYLDPGAGLRRVGFQTYTGRLYLHTSLLRLLFYG
jgi:hypothetical protein